jgi:hypothetical protein
MADSNASGKSQKDDIREEYIQKIKAKVDTLQGAIPFIFEPPVYRGIGCPDVKQWYYKPVIVFAPHKQFPTIAIPCENLSCSGNYVPIQWVRSRTIQGLHCSYYLLQFRYGCSNAPNCKSEMHSCQLLTNPRCPDIIRVPVEEQFYLTYNSGMTGELFTYLLNDALSPKSFEDIQTGIKAFRYRRYLQKRAEYEAAVDHFCKLNNMSTSGFAEFSAIDDIKGYNEDPNIPTLRFLHEAFKGYVRDNSDFMRTAFDNVPPFPVMSIDHTFNVSKRTKTKEKHPPPELLPPGYIPETRYVGVEEDATLLIMGANGQVC